MSSLVSNSTYTLIFKIYFIDRFYGKASD